MLYRYLLGFSFFAVLFSFGCTTTTPLSRKHQKQLDQLIAQNKRFNQQFTGFALYDPSTQQFLYQKDADKYFTPASNTKIFTLYTTLQLLGDSLPALQYQAQGDSLVFWGTGNPLLLNARFEGPDIALDFLRKQEKQLYYCPDNMEDPHFGAGWAWDDAPYAYQTAKAALPLYNNQVHLVHDTLTGKMRAEPPFFERFLQLDASLSPGRPQTRRASVGNTIYYNQNADTNRVVDRYLPFDYSPALAASLLSDTLRRYVSIGCTAPTQRITLSTPLPDTLLRRLMLPSDNFTAEQLLLMVAAKYLDTLSTDRAIAFAKMQLFADSPDELVWRDGSGLSRYNLFTPRSMIYVLEKLYQSVPKERLFSLFPTGGKTGTIRKWYGGTPPYVFAKTGTMSNKHCLSGYLIGKSGKVYLFSFMHNHYVGSSRPLKVEMERVLGELRLLF
ncbi:MAG: D-alanyl-D-alanine carboxypeptidase [Bacteroidota bacterium]